MNRLESNDAGGEKKARWQQMIGYMLLSSGIEEERERDREEVREYETDCVIWRKKHLLGIDC